MRYVNRQYDGEHSTATTTYVLLAFLADGPASGYDLRVRMAQEIAHVYPPPAKSQTYDELHRMDALGWATVVHVEQAHRPNKRIYTITDAGRVALCTWLTDPCPEPDYVRSPTMVRLCRGAHLSTATLCTLLRGRLEALNVHLVQLQNARAQHHTGMGEFLDRADHLMVLSLTRAQMLIEQDILWTESALEDLPDIPELKPPGTVQTA